MVQDGHEPVLHGDGTEPGWEELYLLGGIAAIVLVLMMLLSVGLFVIWPNAPGLTATVDLFTLVHDNTLAGLTALDLGVSLSNLVSILLYLALYVALGRLHRSFALISLAFGLVAVASLIAARPVFEIFTLSDLFASTTDGLAQARYLAAGEALLVLFHGTAFKNYILLGGLSLLISSWLMLRDGRFGKAAAYAGLLGNAVSLGFLLPTIGAFFALLAMPILAVWFILLARTFLRLGRPS
jgi:hypothetical protein